MSRQGSPSQKHLLYVKHWQTYGRGPTHPSPPPPPYMYFGYKKLQNEEKPRRAKCPPAEGLGVPLLRTALKIAKFDKLTSMYSV